MAHEPDTHAVRSSPRADWSLERLLDALRRRERATAAVLIGSSAGVVRDESDYDLLIVVPETVPFRTGVTALEERLTDLVFAGEAEIDALGTLPGPLAITDDWPGRFAVWIADGTVVFDATGRTHAAKARLAGRERMGSVPAETLRERWGHAHYNVAQSRRYAFATDPHYLEAFTLRMTYQLADAMTGYFHARGLPWRGEKEALRYWQERDPAFLAAFRACLAETEPRARFALYEEIVGLTYAPIGPPWPPNPEGLTRGPDYAGEDAFAYWDGLLVGAAG